MTLNGWIIINDELDDFEAALWTWHEIGHYVMHTGSAEWWSRRPQGSVTVARMERQAWEFAFLYPVWE